MKKNKKYKTIFKSLILIAGFFLSYNFSLAAGCCLKTSASVNESNCVKNVSQVDCATIIGTYVDGDPNCDTDPTAKNYCVGASVTAAASGSCAAAGGSADEKCMAATLTTGYTCIDRGVCPTSQLCCKANTAATGTAAVTPVNTNFTNPLNFKTVDELLSNVLVAVQRIIGTLALVFIVIGAVMILSSAGNPEMVERGKKAITMAIIGLAIGVAAPSLLKELATIIGWGPGTAIPALTLSQIAVNVLQFLLGVAGVLTLIMLVIGGIMYLTSAGDEDRIAIGKKIFFNSLIGIVIILASMVLVQQIAKFFVA